MKTIVIIALSFLGIACAHFAPAPGELLIQKNCKVVEGDNDEFVCEQPSPNSVRRSIDISPD